jgi:putative addiction module component (TIGR02574 family)
VKSVEMNTTSIRQKLHNYLEVADDKKLKAIYTIVEDAIQESEVEYTDEFKAELDRRFTAYSNGTEKTFTAEESKERIMKLIQKGNK